MAAVAPVVGRGGIASAAAKMIRADTWNSNQAALVNGCLAAMAGVQVTGGEGGSGQGCAGADRA